MMAISHISPTVEGIHVCFETQKNPFLTRSNVIFYENFTQASKPKQITAKIDLQTILSGSHKGDYSKKTRKLWWPGPSP